MRIIKFRGKDIKTGEWLYGNLQVPSKEGVPYFMWDEDKNQREVDPETIGQFTSLYDANGKEIYEGDIINIKDEKIWLEVRFVRGVFAFLYNGDLDDECPSGSPTDKWAVVTGNIHDGKKRRKVRG